MKAKNHKVHLLALTALLAGGAGLAGCGTYVSTGAGVASDSNAADSYEVACPRDIVNDPYPGVCRLYVDDDNNGICDLSEPSQSDQSQLSSNVASTDEAQQSSADGCPLAPCVICGICANLG